MHKHNVLGLDIPMQYFMAMHQMDGIKQIPNNERSGLLWQSGATRYHIIKLTLRTQLKNNVDVIFISKKAINLDYVWMFQEFLDL